MGIKKWHDFETVYQFYLAWFEKEAVAGAVPLEKEEVLAYQIFNDDIYENDELLLNRMYFSLPLSPALSRSSTLENFCFSELNLMEKIQPSNDVVNMLSVEYRIE
ncbi:MAG: hypothetical protein [Chaetfec virus UA24_244]|nr:MAG: hypothetical protein [Chaetfec virus UA24_244]